MYSQTRKVPFLFPLYIKWLFCGERNLAFYNVCFLYGNTYTHARVYTNWKAVLDRKFWNLRPRGRSSQTRRNELPRRWSVCALRACVTSRFLFSRGEGKKVRQKKNRPSPRSQFRLRSNIAVLGSGKQAETFSGTQYPTAARLSLLQTHLRFFFIVSSYSSLSLLITVSFFSSSRIKFRKFVAYSPPCSSLFATPRTKECRRRKNFVARRLRSSFLKLPNKKANKFPTVHVYSRNVLFLVTVIRLFARKSLLDKRENVSFRSTGNKFLYRSPYKMINTSDKTPQHKRINFRKPLYYHYIISQVGQTIRDLFRDARYRRFIIELLLSTDCFSGEISTWISLSDTCHNYEIA